MIMFAGRSRAGRSQRRQTIEDDRILPLINIVFLLLIFFMLAGRLDAADPFEVTPPTSVSTAESGDEEVIVLIGPTGQLAVNGTEMSEADAMARLDSIAKSGTTLVKLKADNGAPATRLVEIMSQLREAGIEKVRLLTVTSDGG